jgi:hypothetical protein
MLSDVLIYFVAVFLGLAAGFLQIRLGDLLITALFVLLSTMVLGSLRPRWPWRWTLIVGFGVPLMQLIAYLLIREWEYRAQMWEAGLGFLTGIAGAYCGAFGRKAVEELFFPKSSDS